MTNVLNLSVSLRRKTDDLHHLVDYDAQKWIKKNLDKDELQ